MEMLLEVAGWVGAATTLSAYLAVSMNWLRAGRGFQIANLLGACAFIFNGAFHGAWPSVATNIAWFLISALALFRLSADGIAPEPAAERPPIQYPGVCDTTQPISIAEIFAGCAHVEASEQSRRP